MVRECSRAALKTARTHDKRFEGRDIMEIFERGKSSAINASWPVGRLSSRGGAGRTHWVTEV